MAGDVSRSVRIVAIESQTGDYLANALLRAFPRDYEVDLERISADTVESGKPSIPDDCLVMTAGPVTYRLARMAYPGNEVLLAKRDIDFTNNLSELECIPMNERVAIVNRSLDPTLETMNSLKRIIDKPLEFVPYWNGSAVNLDDVETAVSPGMMQFCPVGIKNRIDIGMRDIALATYVQIFFALGLRRDFVNDFIETYFKRWSGVAKGGYNEEDVISRCHEILTALDDSTFVLDRNDRVYSASCASERMLGMRRTEIIGRKISDLIEGIPSRPERSRRLEREAGRGTRSFFFGDKPYRAAYIDLSDDGRCFLAIKEAGEGSSPARERNVRPRGIRSKWSFDQIVGSDPAMVRLKRKASIMARNDGTILICGETGTGKELFAQAIHNESGRRERPFMAFSFAALSESLIESELFGYEDGAFTGARKGGRRGLFEEAQEGTVFLDEIGDASPHVQSRLLRVLQEKEVIRVGSTRTIGIDVKILAATNRDLLELVKSGQFRADLYYRLRVLTLTIPPLRDRPDCIPELLEYAMRRFGIEKKRFSGEVRDVLLRYGWPGNVRELVNTVEYLACMAQGDTIGYEDLPGEIVTALRDPREGAALEREASDADLDAAIAEARSIDGVSTLRFVLEALSDAREKMAKAGRKNLVAKARECGLGITEDRMRGMLNKLNRIGFVQVGQTKQGTAITAMGNRALARIRGDG